MLQENMMSSIQPLGITWCTTELLLLVLANSALSLHR